MLASVLFEAPNIPKTVVESGTPISQFWLNQRREDLQNQEIETQKGLIRGLESRQRELESEVKELKKDRSVEILTEIRELKSQRRLDTLAEIALFLVELQYLQHTHI